MHTPITKIRRKRESKKGRKESDLHGVERVADDDLREAGSRSSDVFLGYVARASHPKGRSRRSSYTGGERNGKAGSKV